jgi:regulator of replication initiation timing
MAHSILSKIQGSKSRAEAAEIGITDRVYQAMMEDARDEIRTKAVSEARLGVASELANAKASATLAQADTAKAQAEATKAQATADSLRADILKLKQSEKDLQKKATTMEKVVKLEQGTLTAKDLEYKAEIKKLEESIKSLRGERHSLEIENSRLKGRLEAPKPKAVARAKKSLPKEFEIVPVYGGPENRIMSASVKVKG